MGHYVHHFLPSTPAYTRIGLGSATFTGTGAWQAFMLAHAAAVTAAKDAERSVLSTWGSLKKLQCVIDNASCKAMHELAKQNIVTLEALPGALRDALSREDPEAFALAGSILAQAKTASEKYLAWAGDSGLTALVKETLSVLETRMKAVAETVGKAAASAVTSAAKGAFKVSPVVVVSGLALLGAFVIYQMRKVIP